MVWTTFWRVSQNEMAKKLVFHLSLFMMCGILEQVIWEEQKETFSVFVWPWDSYSVRKCMMTKTASIGHMAVKTSPHKYLTPLGVQGKLEDKSTFKFVATRHSTQSTDLFRFIKSTKPDDAIVPIPFHHLN